MEQLIKDLINNDLQAQTQVYETYYKSMYNLSIKYTNNIEDTEDVLSESFMSLFKNCFKIKNNNVHSYLHSIVKNHSINKIRSRKTNLEVDITDYRDIFGCVDYEFNDIEFQDIVSEIEKLPTGYKTVFNSYVLDGKSHKIIGKELNITEGTSRSQLSKAKKSLKKQLLLRGNLIK
jgi:RNA polymerase sigma-70 factor (ECF subfamily)